MNTNNELVTIKVKEETRQRLRLIHAETGESILAIVERLALGELKRLKESKMSDIKIGDYVKIATTVPVYAGMIGRLQAAITVTSSHTREHDYMVSLPKTRVGFDGQLVVTAREGYSPRPSVTLGEGLDHPSETHVLWLPELDIAFDVSDLAFFSELPPEE